MTATRLSVIMPTHSRADVLERCVNAYLAQLDPLRDELIIVDDGSVDATPEILRKLAARSGGSIRHAAQANAGPASARNRGLSMATGAILLFAGDDVMPDPGTIAAHLAAHSRFPNGAVLGRIQWHPDLPLSSLMRWLESGGLQFDFRALKDGDLLDAHRWYSSNLSIPRGLLPSAPVFDERFRAACWEDVDLGIRLAAAGVPLRYVEGASASHWHPTDLAGSVRRAERVGYYRAMLEEKHRLPSMRWSPLRLRVTRLLAPFLRALPHDGLRNRGFRWTLEWPRYLGQQRFLKEQGVLHSAP